MGGYRPGQGVNKSRGFVQHVDWPTHFSGSTLDLVLTMSSAIDSVAINDLIINADTGTTSDHYLVKFQLPVETVGVKLPTFVMKDVREYKKIDLASFREDLFFSPVNLSDLTSVDQAVDLYLKTVQDILDCHAPFVNKRFNLKRSSWWNEKCQLARASARKAQRKYKKDPQNEVLLELYNEKCIDKAIIIDKARNSFFD